MRNDTGHQKLLQKSTRENELAYAEAYGVTFSLGEAQGFHYCACHRLRTCSEYSKQGLYTLKMARVAAAKIFRKDEECQRAFIAGFKSGYRKRSKNKKTKTHA